MPSTSVLSCNSDNAFTARSFSAGEIPWIRRIISEHHEAAQRSGAKIVPSCAYNSMVMVQTAIWGSTISL